VRATLRDRLHEDGVLRDERTAVTMATGALPDGSTCSIRASRPSAQIIAHGVHLDDAEIEILKTTKPPSRTVPSSNLKLGSGIAQVARLRSARINRRHRGGRRRLQQPARRIRGDPPRDPSRARRERHGNVERLRRDGARDARSAKMLKIDAEVAPRAAASAPTSSCSTSRSGGPRRRPRGADPLGGASRAVRHVLVDGEFLVRDGRPMKMDANEVARRSRRTASALS